MLPPGAAVKHYPGRLPLAISKTFTQRLNGSDSFIPKTQCEAASGPERNQNANKGGMERLTDSGKTGLLCRPEPEVAWKFLITLIHCAPNQTGLSRPPGFYLTLCFFIDFLSPPPSLYLQGWIRAQRSAAALLVKRELS